MWPTEREPSAGSFVHDQVEDLRELGVEVDVLAFDGRERTLEYARAAERLRKLLRSQQVDLVHAHYGLTGAVSLTQRRVPVVTTFHGSDVGYVPWQRAISWVVARATTPIFVARVHACLLGLGQAAVIPAGVDTGMFVIGSRDGARRRLGWRVDGRYVLLPGSRTKPVKGPELFDATLARLEGATGVPLEGFTRPEVVDVLNAVDVVLVTSRSEGSPVTVKEALACGTPVVTVDVGDVPHVVRGLPGCSVRPRDPAALALGVAEALEAADREALRARALEYERLALARRVIAVYEAVLS
ncbi:MAG TPA: glycosyltransferase [Gaiellaceae bacterium]|nr:glycosyltransferase [Gaiellaceae bacterium]